MIRFTDAWVLITAGCLFCISGILLFRKNIFEEDRSPKWPLLVLLMGVVLITLGSAKQMHLINL